MIYAGINAAKNKHDCFLINPDSEVLFKLFTLASFYALLSEFPGASYVASVHLTRLANLLSEPSKGTIPKIPPSSFGTLTPICLPMN